MKAYREPAERPEEPPPPEPTREDALGPLLATFRPLPLWRSLVDPWLLTLRGVTVALHRDGLVIHRRAKSTTVLWDDVDELWMNGDRKNGFLRILDVTVRLHDRKRITVPLQLTGSARLYNEIVKGCSTPLIPQALDALRRGEVLTFGPFKVDANGIRNRWFWETTWSELSLVRFHSGEIALHKRTRFLNWRTIDLTDIPHATVLIRVIREYAPKCETA